jgi:ribosomal protein S18 acetylase RimI-like enzyme
MTPDDVVAAAEIHARELPHGYFAHLGRRFLRAYHRTFVTSPHAVAMVATLEDRVAGFLVGTLRTRAHWGHVLRRQGWRLLVAALEGLVRHPSTVLPLLRHRLRRYVRALARYTGLGGSDGEERRDPRRRGGQRTVAVLTHVAVLPAARGHGLGAGLVEAFLEAVRQAGVREVRLVTLAGDEGASAFYERLGWERLGLRNGSDGHQVVEFRWRW